MTLLVRVSCRAALLTTWLCLSVALPQESMAEVPNTSFLGYSGLLKVPTAAVVPDGYFTAFYSNDIEIVDRDRVGKATTAGFLFGVAPFVELGGRLATQYNPAGRTVVNDLVGTAKVSFYRNDYLQLAAGLGDLGGEVQKFGSRYLVATATHPTFGLRASIGYGTGPDRLKGILGGLSWRPLSWLEVMADYDAEDFHAGVRLTAPLGSSFSGHALIKGYSGAEQSRSGSVSFSGPMDLGLPTAKSDQKPDLNAPELSDANGLRLVGKGRNSHGQVIVAAENAGFRRSQKDALGPACLLADNASQVVYQQYRYGIPVQVAEMGCQESGAIVHSARWQSQWGLSGEGTRWDVRPIVPWGLEIRLEPDERSFVGTDAGRLDYSLAAQVSGRVQLPYGLGGYVTYDLPLDRTDDFADDKTFDFFRHRKGFRESAAQLALHPLPGVLGVMSVGMFEVNEIRYFGHHADIAMHTPGGAHRLRYVHASYDPESDFFLERGMSIASYRWWWSRHAVAAEILYGEHFYGDKGYLASFSRYFGDTRITLFARLEQGGDEDKAVGLAFSMPLTPRKALQLGPLTITGSPRWSFSKATTLDNSPGQGNVLKPLLLFEHQPEYNLPVDWLDSGRLF